MEYWTHLHVFQNPVLIVSYCCLSKTVSIKSISLQKHSSFISSVSTQTHTNNAVAVDHSPCRVSQISNVQAFHYRYSIINKCMGYQTYWHMFHNLVLIVSYWCLSKTVTIKSFSSPKTFFIHFLCFNPTSHQHPQQLWLICPAYHRQAKFGLFTIDIVS